MRYHESLAKNKDETAKSIAELFLEMTTEFQSKHEKNKEELIKLLVRRYHEYGGTNKAIQDCEKVIAKGSKKHLPYIWKHYKSKRTGIFSFLQSVNLESVKHNKPLMQAIKLMEENRKNKKSSEWIKLNKTVDLSFAPRDWLPLITRKDGVVQTGGPLTADIILGNYVYSIS